MYNQISTVEKSARETIQRRVVEMREDTHS